MSGWRVQLLPGHARGVAGVKVDLQQPYGAAYRCRQCDSWETTKHLHLRLDDSDATIVSQGIADALQRLGLIGTVFEITNEAVGPQQTIVLGGPIAREDFASVGVAS
jgi:hypothetical protein